MSSVNKVILIGALGADPERRATASGDAFCTLRVATSDKWRDKASGEMREGTEWHCVVLFRQLADLADRYLRKGSPVYVEGRLRTRKWQDREGRNRWTTEIEASELRFLGSSDSSSRAAEVEKDPWKTHESPAGVSSPLGKNDVPF